MPKLNLGKLGEKMKPKPQKGDNASEKAPTATKGYFGRLKEPMRGKK